MADSVTLPDVTEAVRRFEESEQTTRDARLLCERDIDYRDNKQWTKEEESALKKRGQPVVTYNRIGRKVNFLKGLEAQTRKDPKCFPRTPGDDGSAQAGTDALRYVCDDEDWDSKRSAAFGDLTTPGTGIIFVGAKQGKQGIDPSLIQVAWDRHYADPFSSRIDFSDASYQGIVTWLDIEDAYRKWSDRKDIIEGTWRQARDSSTYDDKPKTNLWADYKRKRVRVCEEYYLVDGVWNRCVFTQGGWLEDPAPSPYLDEDGKPECPIKAVSAYIDRDNNRYGEVRAWISPQDEINKRRSKGLHWINSRQLRIGRGVSVGNGASDPTTIKRELAKPDGVFFGEKDDVDVLPTGDLAAANFELLQEAKAEIDLLGPNADLAGKGQADQSGRAIMANQQGGMIEVAVLMDRLRHLSLMVYRAIWARIRQYWTEQRWIRVTDDERNLKWVGLNQPRTMIEVAAERLRGDPQAEQKLALLARDPMAQQVAEVKNPVAEIDVDIIIDEGMDTPTVQAEQFDTLTKMMPSLTQLPPPYAKLVIQASQFRDKDKLLEIVDQISAPNPMMEKLEQIMQQLELQNAQATIDKTKSETVKNYAQAESAATPQEPQSVDPIDVARLHLDREATNIDGYRAETERIEAVRPPEQPRQAA